MCSPVNPGQLTVEIIEAESHKTQKTITWWIQPAIKIPTPVLLATRSLSSAEVAVSFASAQVRRKHAALP